MGTKKPTTDRPGQWHDGNNIRFFSTMEVIKVENIVDKFLKNVPCYRSYSCCLAVVIITVRFDS
jgi:hypothetical protein